MSNTVLTVYKDCLNQDIIEGGLCVYHDRNRMCFGDVVESRKRIKLATTQRGHTYVNGKWVLDSDLTVVTEWRDACDVVMVEEDWLYEKLDAPTLYKMATIRAEVNAEIEKVKARKERKRKKEEAGG